MPQGSARQDAAAAAVTQARPAADVAPRHIASLTACRGIAALIVLAFHYTGGFLPSLSTRDHTAFLAKGYLWVDFFFLLSGFVLVHVYGARFRDRVQAGDLRRFLFARFSRIYPLHLLVLLGYVVLELARYILTAWDVGQAGFTTFSGPHSLTALLSNLLLLQTTGIHDSMTWNGPAWSIGAEWFAYLAFPLLVVGLLRRGPGVAMTFIGLALAGLVLISDRGRDLDVTYDYGLLRCLAGFTIGMLLHRLQDLGRRLHLGGDAACLALILLLGLALHLGLRDIAIPPLMALLVLGLALNTGRVTRALSQPVLVWLGTISYSVYMVHMLVLAVVNTTAVTLLGRPIGRFLDAGQSLALLAVMTCVVLGLATLLHRLAEVRWPDALKRSGFAARHIYR